MSHLSNRRLKEIRSLTRKKYRERHRETLVEGLRGLVAALDAGADVREVLVTETARRDERLRGPLEELADRVHVVEAGMLDQISDVESSQGIAAVVGIEMIEEERLASCRRVLALDRLRDPGNAGALVRSAAWFGVDAVVTGRATVDLYNPKAVRSAMGGIWDIRHSEVDDLAATLRRLRDHGFSVHGADMHGVAIDQWKPSATSVLILGSEAHGLSNDVRNQIDDSVLIPGRPRRGGTESLNVAVAAGILMYEWTRAHNRPVN